jgi:hypothetical protein
MKGSFHCCGSSSLFQIELISLWISEDNVLPAALISSARISSVPGDLYLSSFSGNFSVRYHIQTGSGAHPASYPVGTRGSFPGGKAAWA